MSTLPSIALPLKSRGLTIDRDALQQERIVMDDNLTTWMITFAAAGMLGFFLSLADHYIRNRRA